MRVSELTPFLTGPTRLRVWRGKDMLACNYFGAIDSDADMRAIFKADPQIEKFSVTPEITHREWKERGLMKPMEPEIARTYEFKDLQMLLYYDIYVK